MLRLLEGQIPFIDASTKMPPEFDDFQANLESARSRILALMSDFDDKGSPPYSEETLANAISFLKKLAYSIWKLNHTVIALPKILPGPEGSVDVCWKTPKFQLLINFPKDPNEPASYYGDDHGANTTEGLFDGSKLDQIFLFWLLD
jgi:hypothetical protein